MPGLIVMTRGDPSSGRLEVCVESFHRPHWYIVKLTKLGEGPQPPWVEPPGWHWVWEEEKRD